MDCSTPGFPVLHHLLEFPQTHVHWVSDAIQPSHPLSPSSALNLSQHQSFPMSRVFTSSGQSTGASASVLNIQSWFPCSRRDSQESFPAPQFKSINSLVLSFFMVQLSHPYMTTRKTIALTRQTLVGKVMSQLFNMLSRLVITFLPRSKRLLISWMQSPSAVILEPRKIKSDTVTTVSPSIAHEVMGPDAMIFVFWMLSFKPTFSTLLFHFRQEAH